MKKFKKIKTALLVAFLGVVAVVGVFAATNAKAADLVTEFSLKTSDSKTSYLTGETFTTQMVLVTNATNSEVVDNATAKVTIPKDYVTSIALGSSPGGTTCSVSEDTDNFYVSCQIDQITGGYSLSIPINVKTTNLTTPNGSIVHLTAELTDGTNVMATSDPLDVTLNLKKITVDKGTCPITYDPVYTPTCTSNNWVYGGLEDSNNSGKLTTDTDDLGYAHFHITLPQVNNTVVGTRDYESVTITDTLPPNAYFDAAKNPGWVNNGNGTISYTIKDGDPWKTVLSLYLKFPGATVNNTGLIANGLTSDWDYTNSVTATVVPLDKHPGEQDIVLTDSSKYEIKSEIEPIGILGKVETVPDIQQVNAEVNREKSFNFRIVMVNYESYANEMKNFEIVEDVSTLDPRLKFDSIFFDSDTIKGILNSGGSFDVYVVINGVEQLVQNVTSTSGYYEGTYPDTTYKYPSIQLPDTDNIQKVIIRSHGDTGLISGKTFRFYVGTKFRDSTVDPLANNKPVIFKNTATATGDIGDNMTFTASSTDDFIMTDYKPEIGISKMFTKDSAKYTTSNALLGDVIDYQLHVAGKGVMAGDTVKNARIVDILPQGLTYIPNSTKVFEPENVSGVESWIKDVPEPTIISNYNGTGQTALIWNLGDIEFPNDVTAQDIAIYNTKALMLDYSVKVSQVAKAGTKSNESYLVYDNNDHFSPRNTSANTSTNSQGASYSVKTSAYTDILDLDNDGDTTEKFSSSTRDVTYVAPEALATTKAVKGDLDSAYIDTTVGKASFNGTASWKLTADNTNAISDIQDFTLIDVLPTVGDQTLSPNMAGETEDRNSAFSTKLTGPVVLPAGKESMFTVYYNTNDMTGKTATEVNAMTGWSTTAGNYANVTAVKIVLKDGEIIAKGTSLDFFLNTKMPARSASLVNKVANNSYATSLSPTQSTFFESNVEGVKAYEPLSEDISVKKVVDKTVANAGDTLTYTLEVTNNDTYQTGTYNLNDILDANLTYEAGSIKLNGTTLTDAVDTDKGNYDATEKSVNVNVSNLEPNEVATITFKAKINDSAKGLDVENQATMEPTDSGQPPVDPSNEVTTDVPAVSVKKAVDKTMAKVGDTLTYTIEVNNEGATAVSNYILKDGFNPAFQDYVENSMTLNGTTLTDSSTDGDNAYVGPLSMYVGKINIPANGKATITFKVLVTSYAKGQTINNQAELSNEDTNVPPVDSNIVKTDVPDVSIKKAVDKNLAQVGEVVTYTIEVSNNDDTAISNYIVSDTIDGNYLTYVTNSMTKGGTALTDSAADADNASYATNKVNIKEISIPANGKVTVTFKATVKDAAKGQTIENTAVLSNDDTSFTPIDSNEVTTNVPNIADVSVKKTVDKTAAKVGDVLTYTLEVTNNESTAISDYILEDTIDGTYATYVTNSMTKGGTALTDSAADADNASYAANKVSIKEIAIPANGKVTVTFKVTVIAAAKGQTIDNQAELSNDDTNIPPVDSNIVETDVPDVSVKKLVDKKAAKVGDELTYTIEVTNSGSVAMSDYIVEDTLDSTYLAYVSDSLKLGNVDLSDAEDGDQGSSVANTISVDGIDVAANSKVTVTFKATVKAAAKGQTIDNKVTLDNDDDDVPPGDDETETAIPDVSVKKLVDKTAAKVGDELTYTIEVTNSGSVAMTDYIVEDTLDSTYLAYVSDSLKLGNVSLSDAEDGDQGSSVANTISVDGIDVAANSKVTVTFKATVKAAAKGQTIDNKVTLDNDDDDVPPGDDETETVIPDVSVKKAVDKTVAKVGDEITYTIEATNNGSAAVSDYIVEDTIDGIYATYVANSMKLDGTALTDSATDTDNASYAANKVSIKEIAIPANDKVTITFKVTAIAAAKGETIDNQATLSNDDTNIPPVDSNIVETDVPDVSVKKAVDKTVAKVGDELTYTIEVTNNGSAALSDYLVEDTIDSAYVTYVANSMKLDGTALTDSATDTDNASYATNKVSIKEIAIPANDKATITFKVTVIAAAKGQTIDNKATLGNDDTNIPPVDTNIVETDVPDVSVKKLVDKTVAKVGDELTYTVEVSNNSTTAVSDYLVEDTIDSAYVTYVTDSMKLDGSALTDNASDGDNASYAANKVSIKEITIPANDKATITFKVTVIAAAKGQTIDNKATLGNDDTNIPPVDTNIVETDVPDVSVKKAVDKTVAQVGDELTYTLEVTNNGDIDVSDYSVEDTINGTYLTYVTDSMKLDGTALTDSATDTDNASYAANKVSVKEIAIPANDKATITFKVTVIAAAKGQSVNNQAVLDNDDTNIPPTDSNIVTTDISDVSVKKVVDKTVAKVGDELTYTIEVSNNGAVAVSDYTVDDTINGTYLTYTADSMKLDGSALTDTATDTDNASYATNKVSIKEIAIPANGKVTITFKATVIAAAKGQTIDNKAILGNDDTNIPPTDSNIVTTDVHDVTIEKAVDKKMAKVGDDLTYTLEITNNSTAVVSNYIVEDTIDGTYLTYVTDSMKLDGTALTDIATDTDNASYAADKVSIKEITIPSKGKVTITFKATVIAAAKGQTIENQAELSNDDTNIPPAESNIVETDVPDVSAKKAVDKTVAKVGDELTYTIEVSNNGDIAVSDYIVEDTIDATYLTYVTDSMKIDGNALTDIASDGDNASYATNKVSVKEITIPANDKVTITFNATVIAAAKGQTIDNQATLDNDDTNIPPVDTNIVETDVPDISVKKAVDKTVAKVGDEITYTIEVSNNGSAAVSDYIVEDTINGTYVTYVTDSMKLDGNALTDIASDGDNASYATNKVSIKEIAIPANDKVTITFKVTAIAAAKGETINNQAELSSDDTNIPPVDSNIVETNVPDVSVKKVVDKTVAKVGDELTYTIEVTNNGSAAVSDYLVEDTIDGTYVTYVANSMELDGSALTDIATDTDNASYATNKVSVKEIAIPANDKATITFKVTVIAAAKGQTIDNQATLDSDDTNIPPVDTNIVETDVPDVSVKKAVDKTVAKVGDELTYTIEVTNNGDIAVSDYLVEDTIDSDYVTYVTDSMKLDGSALTDNASDGDNGSYATNKVSIKEIAIPANDKVTITFKVTAIAAAKGQTIDNKAILSNDDTDIPPVDTNIVETDVPDVSVKKAVDKTTAEVGDELTYTIEVTNNGDIAVSDYLVDDTINGTYVTYVTDSMKLDGNALTDPADADNGSYATNKVSVKEIAIPANDKATITFKVTVIAAAKGQTIDNQATLGNDDSNIPPVDSNIVKTNVPVAANLTIVKDVFMANAPTTSIDTKDIEENNTLRYTLDIENTAQYSVANDVVITDTIPNGLTFVKGSLSLVKPDGTTSALPDNMVTGNEISVEVGTMNGLQKAKLSFNVTVKDDFVGTVENTGNVSGIDPIEGVDDTDSNTTVNKAVLPELVATKAIKDCNEDGSAENGEDLTYTIHLRNIGDGTAKNVKIQDFLDDDEFAGVTVGKAIVTKDGVVLTDSADITKGTAVGDLAPNGLVKIEFVVTLANPIPVDDKIIFNQATATSDNHDPVKTTNDIDPNDPTRPLDPDKPKTPTVLEVQNAALVGTKIVEDANGDGYVEDGETLEYTLHFTSVGEIAARDVIIKDELSDDEFKNATISVATATKGTSTYTGNIQTGINVGDLEVGDTVTVTFKATMASKMVNTGVTPNLLVNQAQAKGENTNIVYTTGDIDPTDPTKPLDPDKPSTPTPLPKENPLLTGTKVVSDSNGDGAFSPGEKITYTLYFRNIGKATAKDVVIKDPLSDTEFDGATISQASATKGDMKYSGNIIKGIEVGDIANNELVVVKFTVTLPQIIAKDSKTPDQLVNQANGKGSNTDIVYTTGNINPNDPSKPLDITEKPINTILTANTAAANIKLPVTGNSDLVKVTIVTLVSVTLGLAIIVRKRYSN